MALLKRSWVKSGYYPLASANDFKVENTQAFHDSAKALRDQIKRSLDLVRKKLLNDKKSTGVKPLYQWSETAITNYMLSGQVVEHLSVDEIKRKIKDILLHESAQRIQVRLQAINLTNDNEIIQSSKQINALCQQLKKDQVLIPYGISRYQGLDRLRYISKSISLPNSKAQYSCNLSAEINQINISKLINNHAKGLPIEPGKDFL